MNGRVIYRQSIQLPNPALQGATRCHSHTLPAAPGAQRLHPEQLLARTAACSLTAALTPTCTRFPTRALCSRTKAAWGAWPCAEHSHWAGAGAQLSALPCRKHKGSLWDRLCSL